MVSLFRRTRSTLLSNQFRELHKIEDTSTFSVLNRHKEKKAFMDVLPEVINSVVTAPNLPELPEVSNWVKQVPIDAVATFDSTEPLPQIIIMFSLFRRTRSTLLSNQFRELHKIADTSTFSVLNIHKEKKALLDVLPEVINSVVTAPNLSELPEVSSWVKQLLDYTLTGGKLLRGIKVSIGYRMFEDPTNFIEATHHSARILGWTIEMAYLLLMDDLMDGATMRRGKPCWHQLQPNIGLNAINDCILIYQSMMQVLEIYFAKTPFYTDLIKHFNEALCRAAMGQHLDLTSGHNKHKNNLGVFTLENYNTIATHKTFYHSFKLPVFAALFLVKNGKEKAIKEIDYICLELGRLLQIQDDYFDAYGAKTTTGKVGTDIQEGKCTWVSVTALQRCNKTQRSVFKEYYGSKDPEHVKRIKQLYDELQMPQVHEQYERSVYEDLVLRIRALPTEEETKFFLGLLHLYYKRLL